MSFWNRQPQLHQDWKVLDQISQLDDIIKESEEHKVAILKHSTSCGISHMVKDQLESGWSIPQGDLQLYYLDLLAHRDISNEIASRFNVVHQSPQVIVLDKGSVVHSASHHSINVSGIKSA